MNLVAIFESASPGMSIELLEGLKEQAEGMKISLRFVTGPSTTEGHWDVYAMVEEPLKPTVIGELQAFAEGYAACWNNQRD